MAVTKAEMVWHASAYNAKAAQAQDALKSAKIDDAIDCAKEALQHADGKLRYGRKHGGDDAQCLGTIELLLEYAPLFFRRDCLDDLDALCKGSSRLIRELLPQLPGRTTAAKELMRTAGRLLSQFSHAHHHESGPHSVSDSDRAEWRTILSFWENTGFVRQVAINDTTRFVLATRMNDTAFLKCPSCGAIGKGPKLKCLDEVPCPRCHAPVHFVILAKEV